MKVLKGILVIVTFLVGGFLILAIVASIWNATRDEFDYASVTRIEQLGETFTIEAPLETYSGTYAKIEIGHNDYLYVEFWISQGRTVARRERHIRIKHPSEWNKIWGANITNIKNNEFTIEGKTFTIELSNFVSNSNIRGRPETIDVLITRKN